VVVLARHCWASSKVRPAGASARRWPQRGIRLPESRHAHAGVWMSFSCRFIAFERAALSCTSENKIKSSEPAQLTIPLDEGNQMFFQLLRGGLGRLPLAKAVFRLRKDSTSYIENKRVPSSRERAPLALSRSLAPNKHIRYSRGGPVRVCQKFVLCLMLVVGRYRAQTGYDLRSVASSSCRGRRRGGRVRQGRRIGATRNRLAISRVQGFALAVLPSPIFSIGLEPRLRLETFFIFLLCQR